MALLGVVLVVISMLLNRQIHKCGNGRPDITAVVRRLSRTICVFGVIFAMESFALFYQWAYIGTKVFSLILLIVFLIVNMCLSFQLAAVLGKK